MSSSSQELPWPGLSADEPILFDIGDELTQNDEDGYAISEFLGRGGSGEVYRLDSPRHGPNRVAKIYLPFFYFDRLSAIFRTGTPPEVSDHFFREHDSMRIGDREYAALAAVRHPYVVSVHDLKQVALGKKAKDRLASTFGLKEAPELVYAIIGSYVEGRRIHDFARIAGTGDVIAVLHGVASALDHLNFEAKILHCDVKPDNIVIDESSGLPMLVDFGLAQRNAGGTTRFFSVPESLRPSDPPTKARRLLQKLEGANSVKISEIWEAFAPWLDRYQFGLLLQRLAADPESQLATADRAFIDTVAERLTDVSWLQANRDVRIAEMLGRAHSDRAYPLVRAAVREGDLRFPSPFRPINVPIELAAFATHPALVRLNRVNQLGLLPARFPGATHTRYLHSLDTYRIARSFVRRLVDRPRFRTIMSPDDVKRLLVSAMYHDINHLPLLHVLQEFPQKDDWPDPFDLCCSVSPAGAPPLDELLAEVGSSRSHLRAMVKPEEAKSLLGRRLDEAESLTASVVSSGLDVDKLSYLQLDSMFSGLGFAAALDLDRLFEAADVTMVKDRARERPVVSFAVEHADAVEAVLRARWLGFRDLYWCDENRAMMAAVLDVVRAIVADAQGTDRLRCLFEESVSLSDYGLLSRLDTVADELGLGKRHLAEFFDGLWNFVGVAAVIEDRRIAASLRSLSAARRSAVDARFGEELREMGGRDRAGPELVAIDVPERNLDLGGEVWIHSGEGTTPAEFGKLYETRLEKMSVRMAVFADRVLIDAMRSTREDLNEHVGDVLSGVIDSVSRERGWD